MSEPLRILYIGDIVGKGGRSAVTRLLPSLQQEYHTDVVLANAENLAHGNGITPETIAEMQTAGIQYFSSGNHIWDNKAGVDYLAQSTCPVIRPANFPANNPGRGFVEITIGIHTLLLINVLGQAFMPQAVANPFLTIDDILRRAKQSYAGIIVDIHAEATSEKQALAHYLDGRVSAVVGTHTHVPTADARILTQGTGLVCDLGAVVAADSVIGADKHKALSRFLTLMPKALSPVEVGTMLFNAVLLVIDPTTHKTIHIERVDRQVDVF